MLFRSDFVRRYLSIVCLLASRNGTSFHAETAGTLLPGECIDLIPQNIIIKNDASWEVIDQEWACIGDIPVGWLLFRAFISLLNTLSKFGSTTASFQNTRMGFIRALTMQLALM